MRKSILPLSPALLVLACVGEPTAASDSSPLGTPNYDIGDAPDASGILVRDETPFAVSWVDPNALTRVTIGADPEEFACDGIVDFDIVPFQDAILPDGRVVIAVQGTNLRTSVWPFIGFECDAFQLVDPLATGVSNLVYTDNDSARVVPGETNVQAWGYTASGMLTRPSGATAVFSAHARFVWDPPAGLLIQQRKITLR